MTNSDLVISDLQESDLSEISWSGTRSHVQHVAEELKRVLFGDAEYIAVRNSEGRALAIGLIDHVRYEEASEIGQLSTDPAFQGQGIGTILIEAAELRMHARGHKWSILGVEVENVRARKLYERLGYSFYAEETDSWTAEDIHGNEYLHTADTLLLRKQICE
jgi:ribosomal protein S18 acetylase RimI-like enzyme